MWGLATSFALNWKQALPQVTFSGAVILALALLALRALIQQVLAVYFQITQPRPQHSIATL